MPKKKATKKDEIPKKVDNEEKQAKEDNKPKAIQWNELEKYMDKPVWDSREKKWRILNGYKRMDYTYSITFTDIADWVSFNDRYLYLEDLGSIENLLKEGN